MDAYVPQRKGVGRLRKVRERPDRCPAFFLPEKSLTIQQPGRWLTTKNTSPAIDLEQA